MEGICGGALDEYSIEENLDKSSETFLEALVVESSEDPLAPWASGLPI